MAFVILFNKIKPHAKEMKLFEYVEIPWIEFYTDERKIAGVIIIQREEKNLHPSISRTRIAASCTDRPW